MSADGKNQGGVGGARYGPLVPPVVGVARNGFGGSGGGGGGGEDDGDTGGIGNGGPDSYDDGGGGGGGGGGGLQIISYDDMTIDGQIFALGGEGGSSFNAETSGYGEGAPGGGGAGGSIWLQTLGQMTITANAEIKALGGLGGKGDGNGTVIWSGGAGGFGYIRLQDGDGSVQIPIPDNVQPTNADTVGEFEPDVILESTAVSTFYDQIISTPNYGDAVIDETSTSSDGSDIQIFVQGSRENVDDPGNPVPPELDLEREYTTDWEPVEDMFLMDNYQFLRFRVEFTVDPLQEFDDQLPTVHEIFIPVSTVPD